MSWINLHSKSTGSLLSCSLTTEQLAVRTKELGYKSSVIMDYGSISLAYEFAAECKKVGVKPIFGLEAFVCEQESHITDESNRSLTRIGIISKNLKGWKALCKAVSQSNRSFYKKPRLALDEWAAYAEDNWIIITGFPGTRISNLANAGLMQDHLENLKSLFGDNNVYVGIQAISDRPYNIISLREAARMSGLKCVAIADSHYSEAQDAADQRVLLCTLLKTTLPKVNAYLDSEEAKDIDIARFFKSSKYYIPDLAEIQELHKGYEEEITNTLEIDSRCEAYSLSNNPILPEFKVGLDAYEALAEKCRDGWKNILKMDKNNPKYEVYLDRIKDELRVIKAAGLSNYFLIVADICEFARNNNILMGVGRGSSGGCLISYLTGITKIDPIPYGLLFSRFFDESRKNSLPDIDLDFETARRDDIFRYIMDKYGIDKTSKISTFSRLQGRGAIRTVLTVHEACDYTTMNEITKFIPDEGKIADELQEMSENDHENAKVLYWAVLNNAKNLKPWVKLEKDGSYSGELGKYFAQAIRLEGLYKNTSEHASGIIVTPGDIDEYCPLIKSKNGLNAGMPYPDLEGMGIPKFDILGINVLDKLKMILNALRTGDIYGNSGDSIENNSSNSTKEDISDNSFTCDSERALQTC